MATLFGNSTVLKFLLHVGAKINEKDSSGATPLQFVLGFSIGKILNCNLDKIVKFLIENGADVNGEDSRCNPPLFYAVNNSNLSLSTVKYLLDHGAIVNCKNLSGEILFSSAVKGLFGEPTGGILTLEDRKWAKKRKTELLKTLINGGLDINQRDFEGKMPLHWAIFPTVESEIIDLLLENGAPVNQQDKFGHSALHLAAKLGSTLVAKALVRHGAQINLICNCGKTPLDHAMDSCNQDEDLRKDFDLPPMKETISFLVENGGVCAKSFGSFAPSIPQLNLTPAQPAGPARPGSEGVPEAEGRAGQYPGQ